MDLAVGATIVGIVLATFASYHVAIRSGTFLRPRLRLRIGHYNARRGYRHPIAIVFGIPARHAQDYYACWVPTNLSSGSRTARGVAVQINLPRNRDASRHWIVQRGVDESKDLGCPRSVTHGGPRTVINYEIPTVRPNLGAEVGEILVFHRSEILGPELDPHRTSLEELSVTVRCENHDGLDASVLFCAVWSDSIETLQRAAEGACIAARIARGMRVFPYPTPGRVFFPLPHFPWVSQVADLLPVYVPRSTPSRGEDESAE